MAEVAGAATEAKLSLSLEKRAPALGANAVDRCARLAQQALWWTGEG